MKYETAEGKMKKDWKRKWSSVYGRMGMVFLSASAVAVLVFLADNSRSLPKNKAGASVVERNGHGEGAREEEYEVKIGDKQEKITIDISEQKYTEEELQKLFADAGETLEKLILGSNQSLDKVTEDLQLVNQIPDTGVKVSWELDNYEVMNLQGELQTEHLTRDGTLVRLKALLTYADEQAEYTFYANLYAPPLSKKDEILQKLEEQVDHLDQTTQQNREMPLPSHVGELPVVWSYKTEFRGGFILFLGMVLSLFLYVSEEQKKKEWRKKREQQMSLDYPQMINRFTLLLGAGMTPKNVWCRIAEDYEQTRKEKGSREVYEEMVYTMREMRGGRPEGECYERFGERCKLTMYRRFGAMLAQNLKKGTKGLTEMLKQEAEQAFEERKNLARRLGEEAETKMLLPMFLMLAVVLIIIVVPAFLTLQI